VIICQLIVHLLVTVQNNKSLCECLGNQWRQWSQKIRTHKELCGEDIWKHKSEWYDVIKLGCRKGVLSAWKDKESGSEPGTTVDLDATVTVMERKAYIWFHPAVVILQRTQTVFTIPQGKLLTWCISNGRILRYLPAFVRNLFQMIHPRCVEYTLKYIIKYIYIYTVRHNIVFY
jgi:hypothetical protein